MQLFLFLFPLQHMKRPALQNKQVELLRMAFRARKVLGTFEKQGPGQVAGQVTGQVTGQVRSGQVTGQVTGQGAVSRKTR